MPKGNHSNLIAALDNRSAADAQVDDVEGDACPTVEMIHGDYRDGMPILPAGAFDGCVCDPTYGLGLADWDDDVPGVDVWREILPLLKPGAVLAAFAARRLYHKLASAVQSAGFVSALEVLREIRFNYNSEP